MPRRMAGTKRERPMSRSNDALILGFLGSFAQSCQRCGRDESMTTTDTPAGSETRCNFCGHLVVLVREAQSTRPARARGRGKL